jgi:hypothetical protein
MERYASVVIWFTIVSLVFGIWRLLRKRSRPGPAAVGMMHEILSDDRRAAIEIIVDDKAGYRDPEDRDDNFAERRRLRLTHAQTRAARDEDASNRACRRANGRRGVAGMARLSSSFYRGMIGGVMAWAVLWGLGALLADMTAAVPSYTRSAAVVNIVGGIAGFSAIRWYEQRSRHRLRDS